MRLGNACLAALLAVAPAGCGTVANCVGWNGPAPRTVYGGVAQDWQNGKEHLNEAFYGPAPSFSPYPQPPGQGSDLLAKSFCGACGVGMLAVDLPVSVVADTLTLPVTVPATLMKKDTRTRKPRPRKAPGPMVARSLN